MLKKISTVARVKLFYVACSKNGFLPWTMENDQRQLLAQFRSTSNSDISSGALLVVLQDICFSPLILVPDLIPAFTPTLVPVLVPVRGPAAATF